MKVIKFESVKSTSMESADTIRKFSDNYPNIRNTNDRRSTSLSKSIKKQNEQKEEQENNINKIDIDSIIKIDYVKSFSVIISYQILNFKYSFQNLEFKDLKFEYQIYEADVCVVFKGKYKALPVAIKIYNLSRLTEENIVIFIFKKLEKF